MMMMRHNGDELQLARVRGIMSAEAIKVFYPCCEAVQNCRSGMIYVGYEKESDAEAHMVDVMMRDGWVEATIPENIADTEIGAPT
jgi:hypothetical protein